MNYEIIGIGRLGSAIAYTMMLLSKGNTFCLREYYEQAHDKMVGEYYDLLPVAKATGNNLIVHTNQKPDAYIIAAGIPRTDARYEKHQLFYANYTIINEFLDQLPRGKPIFVATNPPVEICERLKYRGYDAIPLRKCTDDLRNSQEHNEIVLKNKGFTQYTPAFAIATAIFDGMKQIETKKRKL